MTMKTPKLKRDWVGWICQTTERITPGQGSIPEGALCLITYNYAGLQIRSRPCRACGVTLIVTKVPERAVRLLFDAYAVSPGMRPKSMRQTRIDEAWYLYCEAIRNGEELLPL